MRSKPPSTTHTYSASKSSHIEHWDWIAVLCFSVVANNEINFALTSPIRSVVHLPHDEPNSDVDKALLHEMYDHLEKYGDSIKKFAFEVNNIVGVYRYAKHYGDGVAVQPPPVSTHKQFGSMISAVILAANLTDSFHDLFIVSIEGLIMIRGYMFGSFVKATSLRS